MGRRSSAISLFAGTSPTFAAGATTTTGVPGFANCDAITIVATVAGGTGGVLDVYVQTSVDGVTWFDYWHLPQLTAGLASATYSYSPALNDSPIAIGVDTTHALAAGAVRGGHWFDQIRVRLVPGSGTTVGAAQNVRVLAHA